MNTKKKLMKWVGVVMLAVLATVSLAGTVAAVPGIPLPAERELLDTPPIHMYSNSRVRFEQYMEASAPQAYEAGVSLPASRVDSWARFKEYMAASQPQTYESTGIPASTIDDSWLRFRVYLEHSQ